MKKSFLSTLCAIATITGFAQVKISTPAELTTTPLPEASSILEVKSPNQGVLIPRMSTIQRDAIGAPSISLLIFNTTTDQFEYYAATPVPGWIGISRTGMNGNWNLTGNTGTNPMVNFLGTIDEKSLAFRTFNQVRMLIDSTGKVGVGTTIPNSSFNVYGNNNPGFQFGASQFFVSTYSRPTRLNAAASQISYGLLSHTMADNVGTYNGVAGRVLRTGDTSAANLTAALAHVNNPGNFQTAVLGITNSRLNESSAGQNFSAARFTDGTGAITAAQDSNTYTIFASSARKNYFEGNVGVGTSFPNSRMNVYGNNTNGFAFGAATFYVGVYSRPTRLNAAASQISYGLLSHTMSDNVGTYNGVAGRVLRTGDTSQANLTAALAHVNNPGNFQTAVLGITNSRADQSSDGQNFSAARFTDGTGAITAAQDSNTYTIFASSARKNYFEGNVGVGTSFPNSRMNVYGNNTNGFAFGAATFYVGVYSRPTRLNAAASQISYGLLSHTMSDATLEHTMVLLVVYLRTGDTSQANLTAALAHVNNPGNFQTAVLGITNSRADQSSDGQNFSAARFTDGTGAITAAQDSNTYTIFASSARKNYFEGNVGVGTSFPNSRMNVYGNNTNGFAFGAATFYVGVYSRPTRLNAAASQISYGLLSHTMSDNVGTYNGVAGRVLRTGDTSQANLTAALAHVNNPGNFQTAVLGITNSRADQSSDGQNFSAARFTDGTGTLTPAQEASTFTIFASSARKNYFEGSIGVGTTAPNSRVNVYGNNTAGFPFGAANFYVGVYSRPTRMNAAANEISYGLLSHTTSDAVGTYNGVAGRVLRTGDTSQANLTAALAHVNNPGNFQTAVLGIVNSRADQSSDAQNFSAARLTVGAAASLTPTQLPNTYTVFAPDSVKSFFKGAIGINTNAPATSLDVDGGLSLRASTSSAAAVAIMNRSYVRVSTAGTFTITNGLQTGQVLIIESVAGGNTLADTGNVNSAGDVTFTTAGSTVSLIWNGTQWVETTRSIN